MVPSSALIRQQDVQLEEMPRRDSMLTRGAREGQVRRHAACSTAGSLYREWESMVEPSHRWD